MMGRRVDSKPLSASLDKPDSFGTKEFRRPAPVNSTAHEFGPDRQRRRRPGESELFVIVKANPYRRPD
jgi:hypothetical protein